MASDLSDALIPRDWQLQQGLAFLPPPEGPVGNPRDFGAVERENHARYGRDVALFCDCLYELATGVFFSRMETKGQKGT
jgi:hypothetical protein